jgi:hypothetical protein
MPNASVKGTNATVLTTEKLRPVVIAREWKRRRLERSLCRSRVPNLALGHACTELTPPNVVCAEACACPLELAADEFAEAI